MLLWFCPDPEALEQHSAAVAEKLDLEGHPAARFCRGHGHIQGLKVLCARVSGVFGYAASSFFLFLNSFGVCGARLFIHHSPRHLLTIHLVRIHLVTIHFVLISVQSHCGESLWRQSRAHCGLRRWLSRCAVVVVAELWTLTNGYTCSAWFPDNDKVTVCFLALCSLASGQQFRKGSSFCFSANLKFASNSHSTQISIFSRCLIYLIHSQTLWLWLTDWKIIIFY